MSDDNNLSADFICSFSTVPPCNCLKTFGVTDETVGSVTNSSHSTIVDCSSLNDKYIRVSQNFWSWGYQYLQLCNSRSRYIFKIKVDFVKKRLVTTNNLFFSPHLKFATKAWWKIRNSIGPSRCVLTEISWIIPVITTRLKWHAVIIILSMVRVL